MTIRQQMIKLKENWLLVVVALFLVVFVGFGNIFSSFGSYSSGYSGGYNGYSEEGYALEAAVAPSGIAASKASRGYAPTIAYDDGLIYDDNFAPEVSDRKVTSTSYLTTEVETGKFRSAEEKFKAILVSSNTLLLNEDVQVSEYGRHAFLRGDYVIKVKSEKADALLVQLKEIGEVVSFSQNKQDVTEQHLDLREELGVEKSRLKRFESMFAESLDVSEKIQLTDRIFDIERRIAYLQESLGSLDTRVEYSTIYFNLQEKQSGYANIVVVKFSQLVKSFMGSLNSLLYLIFLALPYVIVALAVWWGVRFLRKK